MLIDKWEADGLLFNMNFKEAVGSDAVYRGELVLTQGEIADAQGRRKPPSAVIRGAVALAGADDKLKLFAGWIDSVEELGLVAELYKDALAPATKAVFYIVNLAKNAVIDLNGTQVLGVPLTDGMVWTELSEMLGLEKADFKGQSAGEKVVTVYDALKSHSVKWPVVAYAEALTMTNNAKRESRGPV